MRVKRIAVAAKGLTITAQMLKFTLGLFLAVMIMYGLWWLFFHNESERTAETNMVKLVNSINYVCQTPGGRQSISFYLPQQVGFKGWLYQQIGISGGNLGEDPYFYVYYEKFPPEGNLIQDFFWTEDLPWSSNLLVTMAADMIVPKLIEKAGSLPTSVFKKIASGTQEGLNIAKQGMKSLSKKIMTEETDLTAKELFEKMTDEAIDGEMKGMIKGGVAKETKIGIKLSGDLADEAKMGTLQLSKYWKKTVNSETNEIEFIFDRVTYKQGLMTGEQVTEEIVERFVTPRGYNVPFGFLKDYIDNLPKNQQKKLIELLDEKDLNGLLKKFDKLMDTSDELLVLPKGGRLTELYSQNAKFDDALKKYVDYLIQTEDVVEAEKFKGIVDHSMFRVPLTWKNEWNKKTPLMKYTFFRIQDMYTPVGATYWDKLLSFYTTSRCGEEQLCLDMGWTTRSYDLPDPCKDKGITNVKLKREGGLGANDPRFYLVSPCVSFLEISREGDTIYIEPKICKNMPDQLKDMPNYCFASSKLINTYVSMEVAAFAVNLIPQCGVGSLNWCEILIDFAREYVITYPYIPDMLKPDSWDGSC